MKKITIENRSEWPTPALEVICPWIAKEAGITWDYHFLIRDCKSMTWGGRGGKNSQRLWLDRHYNRVGIVWSGPGERRLFKIGKNPKPLWPLTNKDHRFKWSDTQTYRTRLELLVFLLAHEACHATSGHPNEYKDRANPEDVHIGIARDRIDRAGMEFHCDAKGYRIMQKFHDEWPRLRPLIYAAMRKIRQKKLAKRAKFLAARQDFSGKQEHAQELLKKWQSRRKAADTKVKKYLRQLRYYQRKIEGRMAASPPNAAPDSP